MQNPLENFLLNLAEKIQTEKEYKEIVKNSESVDVNKDVFAGFIEGIANTIKENVKNEPTEEKPSEPDPLENFLSTLGEKLKNLPEKKKEEEPIKQEEPVKENEPVKQEEPVEEPKPVETKPENEPIKSEENETPDAFAGFVNNLANILKKTPEQKIEQPVENEKPKEQVNDYVKVLSNNKKVKTPEIKIVEKKPEENEETPDIKKFVANFVTKELESFKNDLTEKYLKKAAVLSEYAGGGGTNAVQYANGGTMNGDLNVNGNYLSGGVNLLNIFSGGGGGGGNQTLFFNLSNADLSISGGNTVSLSALSGGGLTDRLVSGSVQAILANIGGGNGTLTLPNNNKLYTNNLGIDLSAGPGGFAELASNNTSNFVWVDDDGAYVTTDALTGFKLWHFDVNGDLIFPTGSKISKGYPGEIQDGSSWFVSPTGQVGGLASADGQQYVQVGDNSNVYIGTGWPDSLHEWIFRTDGKLTVPGAIGTTTGNSKLDLVGFGPNTAYLTTTPDDTTALFMGVDPVELRANNYVSIATNTGDVSRLWTFGADGSLTFPDNTTQTTAFTGNPDSSNWDSNYTTTNSNSASWSQAYTNLVSNSAAYLSGVDISLLAAASGSWNSNYTTTNSNSASWSSVYTNVNLNSSNYALTNTNVIFQNNVTVLGNLTARGTATFANTIFTTTSALSVVNTGPGPALYVFQSAGPYDVASFYDGDGIEVLHVGNANPSGKGFVGINESFPDAELTVNGAISSNSAITVLGGNSNQWNSNYTTSNTNSARWESVYTSFNANSGKYDSNYTTTNSNSANWSQAYTNLTSNSAAYLSGVDISLLAATSASWNSVYSTTQNNSARWSSVYTSFNTNSAKYDSNYTTTNTNSSRWSNWSSVSGNYALGSQYVKLSGDTMTGALSTTVLSADSIFLKGTTRVTSSNDTNVLIGDTSTGSSTLTGTHNFIFGRLTGTQLTSSSNNFFTGLSAGGALKQVNNNVFMGQRAAGGASYLRESNFTTLPAVCKVENNFVVGNQAGFSLGQRSKNNRYRCYDGCGNPYYQYNQYCDGSKNNILIGYKAGFCSSHRACNNIFLGYCAGGGSGGVSNDSCNNTVLGFRAGTRLGFYAKNNTFIGYCAGYTLVNGSNNTFIGYCAGRSSNYSNNNTFIGNRAGRNNTSGSCNVFIGPSAGACNLNGGGNNFLGESVGYFNTYGGCNNFLGPRAGAGNTTGSHNNFFGFQAGCGNTTGRYNNIMGFRAGFVNRTGCLNNFIGQGSGYNNISGCLNNFLGNNTGRCNCTGSNNNFIGNGAGNYNTTGNNNTFIGRFAGCTNNTGANNIIIGNDANFSGSSSLSGVIALGTGALASASNQLVIGSVNSTLSGILFGRLAVTSLTNALSTVNGTSDQWNSNRTTTNTNSANWSQAYTNLVSNSAAYLSGANLSSIAAASGKWDSNYTTTNTNSAAWSNWSSVSANYALGSRYVKLSGDTMTGPLTINDTTNPALIVGNGNTGYIKVGDGTFSKIAGSGWVLDNLRVSGANWQNGITFQTGGVNAGLWSAGTGILSFSNNITESMRLNASGNLGIGTTAPTERLTVSGAISSNAGLSAANITLTNANVITPFSVTDSGQYLIININGTSQAMRLFNYTT